MREEYEAWFTEKFGHPPMPLGSRQIDFCWHGYQAGVEAMRQQLAALTMQCEKVVKWKHLMSYNDSYFGEPAGELKRVVYEIDRSMPIRGDK